MTESTLFTAREADAAHALIDRARWYAREYAQPEDLDCAIQAALRLALELSGGACNLDRLAVLEREHAEFFDKWHDERRRREAMEAL